MIKPGILTSEFWAMLLGIGTLLVSFIQQNCSFDQMKLYGLVIIILGYIGGRTYLKAKALQQSQPINPTGNVVK